MVVTGPEVATMQRTDEGAWQSVLRRDPEADFLYGVESTGIFCRPDCPSRRPARTQVRFFRNADAAQSAGFRACLRCRPLAPRLSVPLVSEVEQYLREHLDQQVTLKRLAAKFGYSPYTVQRLFTAHTGLSPRAYANALRAGQYRDELSRGMRATEAVYSAGFSAPSRAHAAAPLGMRSRAYAQRGRGEQIRYAVGSASPTGESTGPGHPERSAGPAVVRSLGLLLVAATERGLCAVLLGATVQELQEDLRSRFPAAKEIREDLTLARELEAILRTLYEPAGAGALPLDLRATAFQARVWSALRAIPRGETRTYAQVAASLGQPTATRAVARACAENPLAVVVPCHRVVGSTGALTGYRWGLERKRAILDLEKGP